MTDSNLTRVPDTEARVNAPASVVMYPVSHPKSGMGKLGAFALGAVTGAVGVVVTAAIMDDAIASDIRTNQKSIGSHDAVDIAE